MGPRDKSRIINVSVATASTRHPPITLDKTTDIRRNCRYFFGADEAEGFTPRLKTWAIFALKRAISGLITVKGYLPLRFYRCFYQNQNYLWTYVGSNRVKNVYSKPEMNGKLGFDLS